MIKNEGVFRLPQLIKEGMVLQREQINTIWGYANQGEKVTVEIGGKYYEADTDPSGKWQVELEALVVGGPYEMHITKGSDKVQIKDILVGDVWLCGGQSNMELPIARVMERYRDEVSAYENPQIRMFRVPMAYDFNRKHEDYEIGKWQKLDKENVEDFTAAGYFFAKALYKEQGVPIGLISMGVGGSPIEAWMSEKALSKFPTYLDKVGAYKDQEANAKFLEEDQLRIWNWHCDLHKIDEGMQEEGKRWYELDETPKDWEPFNVPSSWEEAKLCMTAGSVWFRKEITLTEEVANQEARIVLGTIVDSDKVYINGTQVGETSYQYPPRIYQIPKGVLKAGKNTIVIRVVCDQGHGGFTHEKRYVLEIGKQIINLEGIWHYKIGAKMPPLAPQFFLQYQPMGLYNAMLAPLSKLKPRGVIWYQGEANTHYPEDYKALFSALVDDWRTMFDDPKLPFLYAQLPNFGEEGIYSGWAEIRQAQLESLTIPHVGMAVTIDIGEWNDLHPLNKKDVGERLALIARAKVYGEAVAYSGPIIKSAQLIGQEVQLHFEHAKVLEVADEALNLFELSEDGEHFEKAKATYANGTVIVWHEKMTRPTKVRYAWSDSPRGAYIYNEAHLVMSPFVASINA